MKKYYKEKYKIDLSDEEIEKDERVGIFSYYGGVKVGECKISEMDEVVRQEEDRAVNVDYFFQKERF